MRKLSKNFPSMIAATAAGCASTVPKVENLSPATICEPYTISFLYAAEGPDRLTLERRVEEDPSQNMWRMISSEMDKEKVLQVIDEICAGERAIEEVNATELKLSVAPEIIVP